MNLLHVQMYHFLRILSQVSMYVSLLFVGTSCPYDRQPLRELVLEDSIEYRDHLIPETPQVLFPVYSTDILDLSFKLHQKDNR